MAAPETEDFAGIVSTLIPLATLTESSQAQLLASAEVLEVGRGSFVFHEGERDSYSFFLLDGQLELLSGGQTIRRLEGGSSDAVHALAQLQPRQMSARAVSDVAVLRVDRNLLDKLAAADGANEYCDVEVEELDEQDDGDWMTRMLQSQLFSALPAANIQRVFSLLETVAAAEGDTVVRQGDPGDYYYVLVEGRAEVSRAAAPNSPGYRLALIGPGDAFGEEALVGGSTRNATVRMLTDGALVRLAAEHFHDLIEKPLLSAVTLEEGQNIEATRGAVWLDVRFPEQHTVNPIENSVNHPLNTLRMHSGRLANDRPYIVYCDDGTKSAVAAFLLAERGFEVHYLDGGLAAYRGEGDAAAELAPATGAAASPLPAEPAAPADDMALSEDDASDGATPAAVPAPVPSSHLTAVEQADDPAAAAAALEVDLEVSELGVAESEARLKAVEQNAEAERAAREAALEEARKQAAAEVEKRIAEERARANAEVEAFRRKAQAEASRALARERKRLEATAAKARAELEAARKAREELERANAEAAAQVERERQEKDSHVQQARAELEAERKAREELERAKAEAAALVERERQEKDSHVQQARAELEAARKAREELERAHAEVAAQAERERQEKDSHVQQVRAEMERRLREEEAKLKESYAWQAEELKRLKEQKKVAEQRLAEERARVEEQSEQARARLAEAREYQARLAEAQQKSAAEAAMREQQQLELKKRLREELQHKVQTERSRLESELARNAAELERARQERAAAEAAREAAAAEAQQIVADFKEAHERRRMQEEAEMQVERERLEAESRRLRLALELAQREKQAALTHQQEIAQEIAALKSDKAEAADTSAVQSMQADLEALQAEADMAAREVARTERARADAQAAAVASDGDLAAHKVHEEQARVDLETELNDWVREQAELENSDTQREILANQKAHLERIKQRAKSAREAAKAHDQSLIDELADQFRNIGDD
ncbi:MAG: cyclic nucleotide-binding domain-containing protein [Gammaproteobacteria bacterium]